LLFLTDIPSLSDTCNGQKKYGDYKKIEKVELSELFSTKGG
jgi:hypothetical protein